METKPILVLYHANCMDGFASACVAAANILDTVGHLGDTVFRAVKYGDPAPLEEAKGAVVYVLDFAYPLHDMLYLQGVASQLIWTDHHDDQLRRDVVAAISEYNLAVWKYDTTLCGATSTWNLLFPKIEVPQVLLYVQDRDLWTWALPHSREISAFLAAVFGDADPRYAAFEFIATDCSEGLLAHTGGSLLLKDQAKRIKAACRTAQRSAVSLDENSVTRVAMVNATTDISEIGDALCQDGADLAVIYWRRSDGNWGHSLRSRPNERFPDAVDCRRLAAHHGGGGHRQAAGFTSMGIGLGGVV